MANMREYLNSKWLSWSDLDGEPRELTVKSVDVGDSPFGTGPRPEVTFIETEKIWGVPPANLYTVLQLLGDEGDDWIGKKLTLFPTKCLPPNETKDCIRVYNQADPATIPPQWMSKLAESLPEAKPMTAAEKPADA